MKTRLKYWRGRVNRILCLLAFGFAVSNSGWAQFAAIKNNLLYDATLTTNLDIEEHANCHCSVCVNGGLNTWGIETVLKPMGNKRSTDCTSVQRSDFGALFVHYNERPSDKHGEASLLKSTQVPGAQSKNMAESIESLFLDSTKYAPYSYVRFIKHDEKIPELTDEQFYDIAGRVIFLVNKYDLPQRDSLIMQLQNEVLPLINKDSLELAGMIIRGAASPEGPTPFNKSLGEHRAATLLQFLRDNINLPFDEKSFDMQIDIEDYSTLCFMMQRTGDKDYATVKALCDRYLPSGDIATLKRQLMATRQGTLWHRLLRQYFPGIRAARVVLFFRKPKTCEKQIIAQSEQSMPTATADIAVTRPDSVAVDTVAADTVVIDTDVVQLPVVLPRREVLSVKSNLLFDFAYMPGYNRWCPIPNVAVEYYPLHGHFTFGFSFDCPWWQHYDDHKFFQIRNYQLDTRYYFRSGDIDKNLPGEGAAFRGVYLQAYGHVGLFGIGFDANRGWVGEGAGAGLGIGYVLPLSKKGHWRMEFGLQAGFFACKYDPYQYEYIDVPGWGGYPHDNLYYYKYFGDPTLFKKRQYRFTWFGPTRVGITLSYDLLYRRWEKKGVSFRKTEKVVVNERK